RVRTASRCNGARQPTTAYCTGNRATSASSNKHGVGHSFLVIVVLAAHSAANAATDDDKPDDTPLPHQLRERLPQLHTLALQAAHTIERSIERSPRRRFEARCQLLTGKRLEIASQGVGCGLFSGETACRCSQPGSVFADVHSQSNPDSYMRFTATKRRPTHAALLARNAAN